jgi:Na+/H+ antiporter NhaD/arsenite permease-like protein
MACAANQVSSAHLQQTGTPYGWIALAIFVIGYAFVVLEERLQLRKSKPMMLAAALIWGLIAWRAHSDEAQSALVAGAFERIFLEFAELFFFLIVAMTYVGALTERGVFDALRAALVRRGFGYRSLFWITGALAFAISPILDNLTTALIMGSVVIAVGAGNARFIAICCVNLVIAANAGGAWSAFGDITTLMVWQAHKVEFFEFFRIFLPSLVNWLVPAILMHFALPHGRPTAGNTAARIRYGGALTCGLFAMTIAITVTGKQLLQLPPVFGMMTGLALLQLQAYFIGRRERTYTESILSEPTVRESQHQATHGFDWPPAQHANDVARRGYNIFDILERVEWDTLLFFYGVLVAVGGLATLGYLELASTQLYGNLGPTCANVTLGAVSALVDNIPILYAALQMNPVMDHGQWLLITLTTGVGGSLLSIGSAAGVALMGAARGQYTFASHLRWTWAIALGYVASVLVHLALNTPYFGTNAT